MHTLTLRSRVHQTCMHDELRMNTHSQRARRPRRYNNNNRCRCRRRMPRAGGCCRWLQHRHDHMSICDFVTCDFARAIRWARCVRANPAGSTPQVSACKIDKPDRLARHRHWWLGVNSSEVMMRRRRCQRNKSNQQARSHTGLTQTHEKS